ncbi:MAG: tRNA1(Val) (adenine(37)-N6)-methyltransferase [Actinomycetota bacterium]
MPAGELFPTTEDGLLGGRVRLRQPAEGYRAAIDPVLLAAAVTARDGDRVLDLGCGVGSAALCLLARVPGVRATGLELQPGLAALARLNAEANGAGERFEVVEGSVTAPPLANGSFTVVMTNPPYLEAARAKAPPHAGKATANVEGEAGLGQWIATAVRLLAPKGRLAVIHRADRLADLLAAVSSQRLGEIRVLPLWPKRGRPAGRVVVTARKDARTPLDLLPGLLLHEDDGSYTAQAQAVLRDGQGL